MRRITLLALIVCAACGFQGNAAPDASNPPPMDARLDGPVDSTPAAPKPRRLRLRIPAAQVTGPLTDFPVYVDLNDTVSRADLKTKLGATATNLSFRLRTDAGTTVLAHELASWDAATGRLTAWVKLPTLEATAGADTDFELLYGLPEVAVAPNPPAVWSNGFLFVFHLDSLNGTTFANAANSASNGTAVNINGGRLKAGQLGPGVEFNNNNQVITFTNPITGSGPSTFSAWVSQKPTGDNDSLIQIGDGAASRSRFFYTRYNNGGFNDGNIGSGLYHGLRDWFTGTNIQNVGVRLLHWTYLDQNGRIYVNGAEIGGSPRLYDNPADTAGTDGRIGNANAAFGGNMGLDGLVDEVRIANIARTAEWIAAEYANQNAPATFVTVMPPDDVP